MTILVFFGVKLLINFHVPLDIATEWGCFDSILEDTSLLNLKEILAGQFFFKLYQHQDTNGHVQKEPGQAARTRGNDMSQHVPRAYASCACCVSSWLYSSP